MIWNLFTCKSRKLLLNRFIKTFEKLSIVLHLESRPDCTDRTFQMEKHKAFEKNPYRLICGFCDQGFYVCLLVCLLLFYFCFIVLSTEV